MDEKQILKKDGLALANIKNQTEELCCIAVRQNGRALRYVHNQTEKICLAAVRSNALVLEYVENQTKRVITTALKKDGIAVQFLKEPSREYYTLAIESNPAAIQFVPQSTDLCLLALKKDPQAFQYINDKTNQSYWPIVISQPKLLSLIDKPPVELCLKAISNDSSAFKYVSDKSYDMCAKAIEINPDAIAYVPLQWPELYKHAFTRGATLRNMDKPPKEICMLAIQADPLNIRWIRDPSAEIAELAVKMNDCLAEYVKPHLLSIQTKTRLVKSKPYLIQLFENLPVNVYLEAVSRDGYCLRYVPEDKQTVEICYAAVANCPNAYVFIKDATLRSRLRRKRS